MAKLTYTLDAPAKPSRPSPADQVDRLFGRDLFFDGDTRTTPAGDWLLVDGREALRQALIRRVLTNPGEWKTLPDYGAGARMFVKAKDTRAARDELVSRIRGQLAAETRVGSVDQVAIERTPDGALKVAVTVTPAGRAERARPVTASVEVT
jgi:phage baseplate assembly protein W